MSYLAHLAGILVPVAVACVSVHLYLVAVRPAGKRQKARRSEAAKPAVERREPSDMSRPWLQDLATVAAGDERLTTCPVCGMSDPDGLDGTFTGEWPAHATCVEWLGQWGPKDGRTWELQQKVEVPEAASDSQWPLNLPATRVSLADCTSSPMPGISSGIDFLAREYRLGRISADQVREVLARTEPATWTVIAPNRVTCDCGMLFMGTVEAIHESMTAHCDSGQHEFRKHRFSTQMWCACGQEFDGSPEELGQAIDAHNQSGLCPHHPNA